jgi:hypothetical protein
VVLTTGVKTLNIDATIEQRWLNQTSPILNIAINNTTNNAIQCLYQCNIPAKIKYMRQF